MRVSKIVTVETMERVPETGWPYRQLVGYQVGTSDQGGKLGMCRPVRHDYNPQTRMSRSVRASRLWLCRHWLACLPGDGPTNKPTRVVQVKLTSVTTKKVGAGGGLPAPLLQA